MSAEETLVVDDQAASIWHVDRTARVTQLISGDPKDPRALVLVRDNGRNSDFIEIEGTAHPEYSARVAAVEAASPRGWEEGAGAKVDATVIMCTVGSCDMLEAAVRATGRDARRTRWSCVCRRYSRASRVSGRSRERYPRRPG